MGRKLIPEPLQAKWRLHRPKNDENAHPRGANGQTGSRNMVATRFLDFSTPTSYSTPNTLWGLTRTVTELPGGNLSITPLLRPSDLEIFAHLHDRRAFFCEIQPNFSRILTTRFRSNFLRPSRAGVLAICAKNPTHGFIVSTKSRPKFAKKKQISNFQISPKRGTICPNPRQFLSDP